LLEGPVEEAKTVVDVVSPPTWFPETRYFEFNPNAIPVPVVVVALCTPYPSVPAESVVSAEAMRYAGEVVARPGDEPFPASEIFKVHPNAVLQDNVEEAFGVEVETAPVVKVPKAVVVVAVLQVTDEPTVALTVTVAPCVF
jgi:hypothetical protein